MTYAPTAATLYGGGPALPSMGNPAPTGAKVATQGNEAATPSMGAAPAAAGSVGSLLDDPAFWLVATVGAVIALAAYSA